MKAPSWSRFGKLYEPVMSHPQLSQAEKVVYACISMHCGRGSWKVGQQRMAVMTRMSTRQVHRCVKALREEGLIRVQGRGKTYTYSLLTPDSNVTPTCDTAVVSPTTSPSLDPRHGCQVDHKRTRKEQEKSSEEKFKQAYLRERTSKHGHKKTA